MAHVKHSNQILIAETRFEYLSPSSVAIPLPESVMHKMLQILHQK
jgi:hypothetical protein